MRLIYVDEAGLSNKKHEPFMVVGAVIVDADKKLVALERYLEGIVKRNIPQEHWDTFIFHATHLFNWGGKVFTKNNPDWPLWKRLEIADELAAIPKKFKLPLAYGVCERAKFPSDPVLAEALNNDPREINIAAHVVTYLACASNVDQWMRRNTNGEVCMMIVEDNDQARGRIREMQNHHQMREIVNELDDDAKRIFPFRHIKEDPLFQPKKRSSVLQLADFWAYVAKRIAMNPGDERYLRFFEPMRPFVYPPAIVKRLA